VEEARPTAVEVAQEKDEKAKESAEDAQAIAGGMG